VNLRGLAPLAGICILLAACSGGGAAGSSSTPLLPKSAQQSATGTLTIRFSHARTAGRVRKATYVSPSTTFVTLWIDGNTTGFRQACSPTASQCTLNWTSIAGAHTFTVAVDDGAAITGPGNILADSSQSETLEPGVNSIPTIILNGVAAQVTFISETLEAANSPTCDIYSTSVNCFLIDYEFDDADGNQIVPPGNFDGDGACLVATDANLTLVSTQCYTNPSGIDQSGIAICTPGTTGQFALGGESSDVNSGATGPFGEVSPSQLATYSLIYPTQSVYTTTNSPTYNCSNGTISTL
jgi:hypothetical protein